MEPRTLPIPGWGGPQYPPRGNATQATAGRPLARTQRWSPRDESPPTQVQLRDPPHTHSHPLRMPDHPRGPRKKESVPEKIFYPVQKKRTTPGGCTASPLFPVHEAGPRPWARAHLFQAPRRRRGGGGSRAWPGCSPRPEEPATPVGMGSTAPPAGQGGQCGPMAAGVLKGVDCHVIPQRPKSAGRAGGPGPVPPSPAASLSHPPREGELGPHSGGERKINKPAFPPDPDIRLPPPNLH